ncbi:hypothetical protein BCR34DRAFT_624494 [Clohesyomyces aquaticus]|uniref:Mitochondrial carrier domain-containing protein n=1 Tax=Clohesyomyces aquaticus TaxID=1231657 RepID=A0A1Y1ZPI9_9PLEO|nr:hypothetical protein BCR34DRAFT_624494 [Clohesyomyces aquaticus]
MGRQAYLTRLALGRSAFETAPSTPENARLTSAPDVDNQRYDERGHPVNPLAREHGRRFREAQNDVLAAIGVVERRRSPSDDLPGAYEERLERLESEDSAGNMIALASTLAENLCSWWLGSLRDRIMTFRMGTRLSFTDIVASEFRTSGAGLIYAGFYPRLISTVSIQASVYAALVFQPVNRLLATTRASRPTRAFFQRHSEWINNAFRLAVEIAFYPFAYHSSLQRLGLIPARPLHPRLMSFIPFSSSSPIRPPVVPSSLTAASLIDFTRSILNSPLVFVCLNHFLERWIYATIYEVIETTVIRPDRPDLEVPDDGVKNRATQILGLRRRTPSPVRNVINKLLVTLGWGTPLPLVDVGPHELPATRRTEPEARRTTETAQGRLTNISRLEIPMAHGALRPVNSSVSNVTVAPTSIPELLSPVSPTASQGSQNDSDDPRIRITSREGIVEMEVRLPPHVLSTRTEVSGPNSPPLIQRGGHPASPSADQQDVPAYHRVTQLSTEPAQMIGSVFKTQIIGWATLPLRLVVLRLIASHYVANNQRPGYPTSGTLPYRGLTLLSGLRNLSVQSVGLLLSRLALCGALEVAIDLSLWGCQWVAVTQVGKRLFNWGTL